MMVMIAIFNGSIPKISTPSNNSLNLVKTLKSRTMKKAIRITAITLGILLLLLITLPFLFKPKIEALVKQEVNKQVEATVNWSKFSLTFFRGFPDLSVNLHELTVIGTPPFEGDTLMALDRFELRVSPLTALKKNFIVKSILLNRPVINGIVLADGTANWDILPPSEEDVSGERPVAGQSPETGAAATAEEAEGFEADDPAAETASDPTSSMGVSLEMFAIRDGRISYDDRPAGLKATVGSFNLEVRGDFSMEETDIDLAMIIHGIDASSGGIRYMKNGKLEVDLLAGADMVNSIYTLKKNEIRLNGLVLGAEGSVAMPADGSIIPDIRFFTRETSFRTLLSMVPAIYLSDFEALETSGSLSLDGTVTGIMKDSIMPDATLNLTVSNGFFSYPDLPKDVSDVQIALKVNYSGANMDATTVSLDRFHLLLGGNPFDMRMQVATPFSDMQVAGMVKGMIDFATLKDIVPMEELNLAGRLDTDLQWNTKMSYIENEQYELVDLDGRLTIEGVVVEAPDIPVPVQLQRMTMIFTPRFVNLETLDLLLGASDLHMDGRLTNFIPYVFDGQTVAGTLNVSSKLLDANEFLVEEVEAPGERSATAEPPSEERSPGTETASAGNATGDESGDESGGGPPEIPADSIAVPPAMKIPENIDFNMTLDLKKLVYDNIVVENLAGKVKVQDGVAILTGLNMNVLKGSVSVDGSVDTREEFTRADVKMNLIGVDIPTSYETFMTIKTLAPVAQYCKGTANVEMDLATLLDASLNPLYGSIDANGHLYARNLKVEQPASLEKLSSMLKNEKLKNLELDRADIRFAIRDGRVIVEPFDMNFESSKIVASGSHGIDQTMDYLLDMNIAKKDMGAAANEMMSSVTALAAGAGFTVPQSDYIRVKANITGTFRDPRVSTDLRGNLTSGEGTVKEAVKEAVKERVTEEVERVKDEVKEEVREEMTTRAAELIENAEAEKARLVKEAEEAGDKLVAEAEKRGEQLIREAGSNPLKQIAAKKSAEELVKQAEKQSARLVEEAETKGDAIVARAREEAAKL
jgi:hypothetical protein